MVYDRTKHDKAFLISHTYVGSKLGFVFKTGHLGTGYRLFFEKFLLTFFANADPFANATTLVACFVIKKRVSTCFDNSKGACKWEW